MKLVTRTKSIGVGLTVLVLLLAGVLLAVRLATGSWHALASTVARAIRSQDDQPHFELLMQ